MKNEKLTADQLRQALHYDGETGVFIWKVWGGRGVSVGRRAGSHHNAGYWHIGIGGERYLAHRLAWLYVHGEWPLLEVDHINGNKRDNRIANLRLATRQQNGANRGANLNNKSGCRGVHWHPQSGRWRAEMKVARKSKHIGLFRTKEEASAAYQRAAAELFGQFAGGHNEG